MGLTELLSFLNLAFSGVFRTRSELLHEEEKHEIVKPEAMTSSMTVSNLWTSLPRAMMSPGLDLSFLRWGVSMRTLDAGNTAPPRLGFERTRSLRAFLTTS